MTFSNEIFANEFVEFATFLFGAKWRDDISSKLGIPRKTLVLLLASGDAVPQEMVTSTLVLVEEKLEEVTRQQSAIKMRISDLRDRSTPHVPLAVRGHASLQHAC